MISPASMLRPAVLILAVSLSACGGGGGGSSSSTGTVSTPSLSYSGVTTAAVLDGDNADQFIQALFDGGSVGGVAAASVSDSSQGRAASGILPIVGRLVDGLAPLPGTLPRDRRAAVAGRVSPAAVINESVPCDLGSLRFSGSVNDTTGTGTLNVDLSRCLLEGTYFDGRLTLAITGFDVQLGEISRARYSFSDLAINEAGRSYRFTGTIDQDISFANQTETLVMNLLFREDGSGYSTMMEDFTLVSTYDSVFYPLQSDVIASGRLYDSRYGFVDVSTIARLHYSSLSDYPDDGEVLLGGAGSSGLTASIGAGGWVALAVDSDGDSEYEYWTNMPWSSLGNAPVSNRAPVANAGFSRTVDKGVETVLDGADSFDPDYDFLTFNWQLDTRPQGSQAVLAGAGSLRPRLLTDVSGDYVITLVVSDGRVSSVQSQVVVTARNSAPQADAGPNRNVVPGAPVVLDGQGSQDRNRDPLTYRWALVGAPAASTATLVDAGLVTAGFTPDLPGFYTFSLVVNDGESDSTEDLVVIRVRDPQAVALCDTDNVSAIPASGSMLVDASRDFIPLCDGWVYFANRTTNSVDYINVVTGVLERRYPLTASPGDLELDADNGLLYATQAPASAVAQVDIISHQQASIPLAYPALNMAAGNDGRLFVAMDGGTWFQRPVSVVDGPLQTVVNTVEFTSAYLDFIVFDRPGNQLIGAVAGLSPSYMYRYSFNPADDSLAELESLRGAGSNGQDLAISPDGNHVAFPNGGGNGNGYTIFDYSSDSLTVVSGEWDTGPYPYSAAFSPFGDRLVAGSYDKLQLFDVQTHTRLAEYPLDFSGCTYSRVSRVGFSRGGRIVFVYSTCGFNKEQGKLFWVVVGN